MDEAIFFYTPDGPHGAFSNFAKFGVALDGAWWPTAEHFFQAQKFHDPAYREKIRRASTAKQAADLGRTRIVPLRPDWDEARVEVMRRVVTAKFETHPALRELLLSTGNRPLVESAPGDAFWGVGPDGVGENRLGRLLEELRARFRAEAGPQSMVKAYRP
jgi:hypothetical protein